MQSLSHWDSEKVFVQKFLFEATFLSFFYTISYNFSHKKTFFIPHKLKKKFPPKGLEKGHNGNNHNLSARK